MATTRKEVGARGEVDVILDRTGDAPVASAAGAQPGRGLARRVPLKRSPFRRTAQSPRMAVAAPVEPGRNALSPRSALVGKPRKPGAFSTLRPVSAKRRATFPARRSCVAAVIERDGGCVFQGRVDAAGIPWATPCSGPLTAHEPAKRSHGAHPTNPDECVALCDYHHGFVHRNVSIAEGLGLLERANGYPIRHVHVIERGAS